MHLKHWRVVFGRLRMANLKLNGKKGNFFKCELHYLGHLMSGKGIHPLPEKLQSIKDLAVLRMPKDVRQMSGSMGYYCKFIIIYENLVLPLT